MPPSALLSQAWHTVVRPEGRSIGWSNSGSCFRLPLRVSISEKAGRSLARPTCPLEVPDLVVQPGNSRGWCPWLWFHLEPRGTSLPSVRSASGHPASGVTQQAAFTRTLFAGACRVDRVGQQTVKRPFRACVTVCSSPSAVEHRTQLRPPCHHGACVLSWSFALFQSLGIASSSTSLVWYAPFVLSADEVETSPLWTLGSSCRRRFARRLASGSVLS